MIKAIALDTESFYSKDFGIRELGTHKYAFDPRCDVYLMSICDGTETWAGHPRDFNFDSLDGNILLSHHAAHDQEIYLGQLERGLWPKINFKEWHCTANMSAYVCNRRSLAEAAEFLLGVQVSKGMRDWMKGRTWEDAVREGKAEELLKYARDDAQLCYQLWDKCGAQWPEWERRLSNLTIEQGRRGVHVHRDRLEAGIQTLQRVILQATDKLPWVAAGRAPASSIGVAEECRKAGIPCPPVKAHDPDAAAEWEETYSASQPWVKALKDLRKAKKTLATLETMRDRIRDDGTMGFSLKYCGAATKRWAGDAGINFQNFNREPLFVRDDFSLEDNRDVINALMSRFEKNPDDPELRSIDVRGLLIPPTGKLLASVDLSQIEPRVLNTLAGNDALLQKIRDGFPIYEAHARSVLGWTGGKLKDENKKLYARAKCEILGLGYGASWEKFITIAKIMGGIDLCVDDEAVALEQSVDKKIYYHEVHWEDGAIYDHPNKPCKPFVLIRNPKFNAYEYVEGGPEPYLQLPVYGANAKKIVTEYRRNNPLIVEFWKSLDLALQDAVRDPEGLVLALPSGNKLTYRKVEQEVKLVQDPINPALKWRRYQFSAETDGRRHAFWGSKLAENVTQSLARDVFAENMLKLVDAGIEVGWSVHDEAVCFVSTEDEARKAREIMASTPAWLPGCPVDAEVQIGDRYRK